MRRRPALLAVICTFLFGCGPSVLPPSAPSVILDKPLPSLAGRTVQGETVKAASLANRVVVVKFFAKYCVPCKKTLPAAERLHRAHDDITFIGVAEDDDRSDVEEMIQTYDLTFPVIHDPGNIVAGRFGVSQLPATFVTDARGRVRWVGSPGQQEQDLEAAIVWAKQR